MAFWQRLLITLGAMVIVSFILGYAWLRVLGFDLPDYAAGVVGGLTALPLWDFLKRVRPKGQENQP